MLLIIAIITQSIPFLLLALAISISFNILRATDMTLDGSFVLGAAIFARGTTLGFSPLISAGAALLGGVLAGTFVACIQRKGHINSLLAGILATFILSSLNLFVMGKPNINLLAQTTLISSAFNTSEIDGWIVMSVYVFTLTLITFLLMNSLFGLRLRAFGENPALLHRLGKNIEFYRLAGFALTNALAAAAGCFTAQIVGYADIGMGFGMTLTGLGAIILGKQLISRMNKKIYFRLRIEFLACLIGVITYFFILNLLLRLDVDLIYLKMLLGLLLIIFLRAAMQPQMGISQ